MSDVPGDLVLPPPLCPVKGVEQIVGVDATVLDIGVAFPERHGAWPVPWSDLAAAIDAAFERPEEQAT